MSRGKLKPFKYRTNDGQVHTMYAPDRLTSDYYAVRWAKRMGYTRIVRLKQRRAKR